MKKVLPVFIAIIIIVGGASFYGGMKYGEGIKSVGNSPDFANLSATERQQRFQQMGGARQGSNQPDANFINGEIIAQDDNSITVKLNDGGSKIIFFSNSTKVTKIAEVTAADLNVGTNVMANSKTNEDGSLTAQSIQIRPETPINGETSSATPR